MFVGYNVRSSDKVDVSDGGTIARRDGVTLVRLDVVE